MPLQTVRQLGAGGFGIVELVVDEHGNQFARKTFRMNQSLPRTLEDNVRKRFVKEARFQMNLASKNIVPVVRENLAHDPPSYLMPVAASSLADDLHADRTLSGRYLSAISDIVSGLEEMHEIHIYHRDLKPQNVLRFTEGGESFYAIGDFGLISQRDSRLSALTITGMAKGSDYYTAPEITADLRQASPQSDIYSLGCVLHDMVGQGPRVPCREIRETGPFEGILRACTRDDPSRRFRSVRSFLDALISLNRKHPVITAGVAGADQAA